MLKNEEIKKIEDFVRVKPRSIQEIANHINKNWRTADRYIEEIQKNFGTLETRVFREGTRGALKIVYWASVEKISSTVFQEQLEDTIMTFQKKENFRPFDIYQFIPDKDKFVWIKKGKDESEAGRLEEFKEMLMNSKKQVLFFSGNLSFVNFEDKKIKLFDVIEALIKKGISIKVICRVDFAARENAEKLLALNFKYGKELVEIHHREQPLRATIIDGDLINIKEIGEPTGRKNELTEKVFMFYTIKNKEWVEWLSRIFWKMFSSSIDSKKRLEEMRKIK
jgi:hypothetical protein